MLRERLLDLFPALERVDQQAWVVGGAVRDLLMDRSPADVDVACIDPLAAARRISERVIRLGDQRHLSAWRVFRDDHVYDFAELLDHEIAADLARRDFTINAMAVDMRTGELLDPHEGRSDIEHRIVRMIKAENFDDDPLRALKAIRMAVRLDFEVDSATIAAIRIRAPRITEIAAERVMYELTLILSAGRLRKAAELFRETGLDAPLELRVEKFQADDVELAAALALLISEPRVHMRRWRWSEALLRDVLSLQRLFTRHDKLSLYDAGESVVRQLPAMLRARGVDDRLDLPDFDTRSLLNGEEIAAITGVAAGAQLGKIKRALVEAQIAGTVCTRDDAERFVRATASA
jgi:tRNA nucleotidyltransferase/poly(A) polymerase